MAGALMRSLFSSLFNFAARVVFSSEGLRPIAEPIGLFFLVSWGHASRTEIYSKFLFQNTGNLSFPLSTQSKLNFSQADTCFRVSTAITVHMLLCRQAWGSLSSPGYASASQMTWHWWHMRRRPCLWQSTFTSVPPCMALPTLRSRTTHFSKSSMSRLFGVQVVVTHVHWLISWCFPLIQLIV